MNWNVLRGFTLIELAITVSVLAIITAIAVPNYVSAQNNAKLKTAAQEIFSMLEVAQSEAILRRKDIHIVYVPIKDGVAGCIGATEDDATFTCANSEALPKYVLESNSGFEVKHPVLAEGTTKKKVFFYSPRTGFPSVNNEKVIFNVLGDSDVVAGVLVRRESGVKGCSSQNWQDWGACS